MKKISCPKTYFSAVLLPVFQLLYSGLKKRLVKNRIKNVCQKSNYLHVYGLNLLPISYSSLTKRTQTWILCPRTYIHLLCTSLAYLALVGKRIDYFDTWPKIVYQKLNDINILNFKFSSIHKTDTDLRLSLWTALLWIFEGKRK